MCCSPVYIAADKTYHSPRNTTVHLIHNFTPGNIQAQPD